MLKRLHVVNGHKPVWIAAALNGDHVGTIVYASES